MDSFKALSLEEGHIRPALSGIIVRPDIDERVLGKEVGKRRRDFPEPGAQGAVRQVFPHHHVRAALCQHIMLERQTP